MNDEKYIIEILIKNSSDLNNKIEQYKNMERDYMDKNAKLSIELIETKNKLENTLIELRKKDNVDDASPFHGEDKKNSKFGDFLGKKSRLSKTWKTLDDYHKRKESKESKLICPKIIEKIE